VTQDGEKPDMLSPRYALIGMLVIALVVAATVLIGYGFSHGHTKSTPVKTSQVKTSQINTSLNKFTVVYAFAY
jgi:preprotein translocase subunit SecG